MSLRSIHPEEHIPVDSLAWLLAVMAFVIAPHTLQVPLWLSAAVVASGTLRMVLAHRGERLPGRTVRVLAVVAATTGIYLSYGTIFGLDAGVAMLCLMAGFKVLELRSRRDVMVTLLLGYFLLVTHFLYDQSLFTAAYMLAAVWGLTTLLITTQQPTHRGRPQTHTRLAATMLAQALPIMVILFLLFPRVPGPLWSMPEEGGGATTGLSDEMSPGSISELSQSDEVAFRAEFDNGPPAYPQRYWRGPVFSSYDGTTWRQADDDTDREPPEVQPLGEPLRYTVTLEPHDERWLLALDLATGVDRDASFDAAHQLRQDNALRERVRYAARSSLQYRLGARLDDAARRHYTHLPDDTHPQARNLAREWRDDTADDSELVEHGLGHFRREPFSYTLQPPRLDEDSIDEFLFDTQAGFCEHYAAAFTVLMRAADIPARVVTGYLGGQMNPAGDYMIVRQSDAHAWVEVWLDDEGWRRVDPTGYVAPERVESGLAGAVPDTDPVPDGAFGGDGFLQNLALRWDAVNAYWNRWVLAYGPNLQQELMDRLKLDSWQRMALALLGAMALSLGLVVALLLLRNRDPAPEPAAREWQRFCHRLAKAGLPRRPDEGPRDYAQRAARQWPEHAATIQAIAERYQALRYGRTSDGSNDIRALRHAVRHMPRPSAAP